MTADDHDVTENARMLRRTLSTFTRIRKRQYEFKCNAPSVGPGEHYVRIYKTGTLRQRILGTGGYVVRWEINGDHYFDVTFQPESVRPITRPENLTPAECAVRLNNLGDLVASVAMQTGRPIP